MAVMSDALEFLKAYAFRLGNGAALDLETEIGFGRECVGIVANGSFLEYDQNAEIVPAERAYHKGPYLAVLGRDDAAIHQLANWCRRWQEAGYTRCFVGPNPDFNRDGKDNPSTLLIKTMLGQHMMVKLVKGETS